MAKFRKCPGLALGSLFVFLVACQDSNVPAWKIPVTTTSQDALNSFLEGRTLAIELRLAEARTRFSHAIEEDSNFALAHLEMARYAPSTKLFQDHLNRASALSGNISKGEQLCIAAVHAYYIEGRLQKARDLYLELTQLYPRDELGHFLLAVHYFLQQDNENCLSVCSTALEVAPEYAPVSNLLGYAHQALGNYQLAEESFQWYIELIPAEPNPYDSYADLLLKTGRYEEAIKKYKQALEISPGFMISVRGIAAAHNFLGRYSEALEILSRVLARADQAQLIQIMSESMAISFIEQRHYDSVDCQH